MANKLQLIMCKGLIASGKSTWTKEQIANANGSMIRVNKDDIRSMLHAGKWSKERESMVLVVRDSIISEALHRKQSVIVDDTNFAPKHEVELRKIAEKYKAEFSVKYFDTPLEECILRDAGRQNPVGKDVILKMYWQYVEPNYPKQVIDKNLPWAIICDLDGTLADFKTSGHRGPYEIDKCEDDDVVEHVNTILQTFWYEKGDKIIFVSGRDEAARGSTVEFLKKCRYYDDAFMADKFPLFMRPAGDTRKDSIVKKEIYEQHIRGKYNIRFVLDDRDCVVNMWRRELGLFCLQVAEGSF